MTIQIFDKQNLRQLRADIEKALETVATAHGITLKIGNIGFSQNNFHVRLEGATIGENGVTNSKEAESFVMVGWRHGFKPEDLGKKFKSSDGKLMEIVGYRTKAPKKPIVLKCHTDGSTYVTSVQYALDGLKLRPVA